jgi:tetratricopeptide (TPR) repeat protein
MPPGIQPLYTDRMLRSPFLLVTATLVAAPGFAPRQDLDAGRYLKVLAEAEARLRANPDDALALAARSQALTATMRIPEALDAARRAVQLRPDLPDALLARGLAQAGSAIQARNLGSIRGVSRAMDDLKAAVQRDPSYVSALFSLGLAYQQLPGILGGSTRQALGCAESLKRLDSGRGSALQGTILALDGRWNEAQGAFGAALAVAPGSPDVIYAYLDALSSRETRQTLGDAEQKRRLAQEAARLLPAARWNARALSAVCDAFLDADQGEQAWKAAQASLRQVDAPSLLRLELGKISARSGVHRTEGLASLDAVLREPLEGGSGGYAVVHWRKGQILKDLGHTSEARTEARAALALDPHHPGAGRLLKELN